MIEWNIIEGPTKFPHACAGCGNTRGPVAQTHRSLPGYGEVYLCENCALTLARMFGYAEGKRLEELSNASKRVTELERVVEQKSVVIDELEEAVAAQTAKIRTLEDDCSVLSQTNTRLRERIREEAEASLAIIGDAA